MADMLSLAQRVFLVLIFAQFILGNLGNAFIVFVNGNSWLKSKRISQSDFLISTLALSRIVLLWIILVDGLLIAFSYSTHSSGIVMQLIDIFWTFTNELSIWLITSLGVLYCLKVSSFSHPAFLWLKWRVSRVVLWMLWGAVLMACGSTLSLINEFKIYSALQEIGGTGNVTEYIRCDRSEYDLFHVLMALWKLPALILSLAAYFLLLLSLGRHRRQMQKYSTSARDQSTKAHKRAIRLILSFLLLFLLYFLSFLILSSSRFLPSTKMVKMISEVITMSWMAAHSFVLILGNKKLRLTLVLMLPCKCGPLNSGSEETSSS